MISLHYDGNIEHHSTWIEILKVVNVDKNASVAELADALGLGPSARKGLGVRVPPLAPV